MNTASIKARICTAIISGVLLSPGAQAQLTEDHGPQDLTRLEGETLREAFSGRTMDGTYKSYRERSGTSTFTETFTADGKTVYREGKINDTGEWKMLRKDMICFRYDGPLAGNVSCFIVFREGTCLYSYNPRRIKDGKPIDTNQWSAKTVIRGELSTCDDLVS